MSLDLLIKHFNEIRARYNNYYFPQEKIEQENEKTEEKSVLDGFVTIDKIWQDANAVLNANQFYAISLVGPQGSGKTSIVREIIKKCLKNDFKVIYALPDDFIDDVKDWVRRTIENPRLKNCIIIDDLSYTIDMQTRKNQALIKNLVSRFRHVYGGQLLVIYVTHRLHAAPPMLRNSGTWIFSAMQSADRDDAREIIGKSKTMRDRLDAIYRFIAKVSVEGAKNKFIKFTLNGTEILYRWGTNEDSGDGRLMACYHGGVLSVFNAQISRGEIDLEKYRYRKESIFTKEEPSNGDMFS